VVHEGRVIDDTEFINALRELIGLKRIPMTRGISKKREEEEPATVEELAPMLTTDALAEVNRGRLFQAGERADT
jgi:hypothetical protein